MVNKLFLDLKQHRLLEQHEPAEFFIENTFRPKEYQPLLS
jgi:hypothetical protein